MTTTPTMCLIILILGAITNLKLANRTSESDSQADNFGKHHFFFRTVLTYLSFQLSIFFRLKNYSYVLNNSFDLKNQNSLWLLISKQINTSNSFSKLTS